jgi:HEPN domain-containing protein
MSDRTAEVMAVASEWWSKAEGDLMSARVLREAGAPTSAVGFHAQQAVEKYIKTMLVVNGIRFGKTHDIDELLELLPEAQRPPLDTPAAVELTRCAVESRYPDASEPSLEDADRLLSYADLVRQFVRSLLPRDVLEP